MLIKFILYIEEIALSVFRDRFKLVKVISSERTKLGHAA